MGNVQEIGSMAWWINREPLRSKEIGEGSGKTAAELNIDLVTHDTSDFLAYESITRSFSGYPNVLISREGFPGESGRDGRRILRSSGQAGSKEYGISRFL